MKIKALTISALVFAVLLLLVWSSAGAQKNGDGTLDQQQTIVGPRNQFLADGAKALISGHGQRGVELTRKGLEVAQGAFEHKAALSNLCVGYLMIEEPEKALQACNEVLEQDPEFWRAYNNRALVYMELGRYVESEADIQSGQALRPESRHLKLTRARLLDLTKPVVPIIEIDERRIASEDYGDGSRL
jgi:tetratricopeptide (TPR) repeat protein